MKKYLRLICSVCNRVTDKLVDNVRVTPDRCTITLNCQGRLFPVEYRSNGQITTAPEIGISDWQPRTTATTAPVLQVAEPKLIDTSTGQKQQLVLALRLPSEPAAGTTASVQLQVREDQPKDYKQFVFRQAATFSSVSGVESGVEKKVLRFKAWGTDPDLVEVYLNGQKLERGTGPADFQVDDGSPASPAPANTIVFNTPVSPQGVAQVDVVVSKAQLAQVETVVFQRNADDPNRLSTGAWENVSHLERLIDGSWRSFYLFTFDVATNADGGGNPVLNVNSILFPVNTITVSGVVTPVQLTDAVFLLARRPFTQVDRYLDTYVPLSTLGVDRDYLKYHSVNGTPVLEVTDTALRTFFPLPRSVARFNPELPLTTAVPGESEQVVLDGRVVVGPDA